MISLVKSIDKYLPQSPTKLHGPFTNLDFPEISGLISHPKRYLLGEFGRVRSRTNLTRFHPLNQWLFLVPLEGGR